MSPLLKKLIASAAAAVVSFLVLFLLKNVLPVLALLVLLALAVGVAVWFRLAVWEIDKITKAAQDAAQKVTGKK